MEKDSVSNEIQELIYGINDFKAYNLLGLHGQPRFAEGQEFVLKSDKFREEIKFSVDKIFNNKMILKSMKKFPSEYFSKNEEINLLSLNEKFVKFAIEEISDKKLTIFSKSYVSVEKPEKLEKSE